jgi:hypothetical protein
MGIMPENVLPSVLLIDVANRDLRISQQPP